MLVWLRREPRASVRKTGCDGFDVCPSRPQMLQRCLPSVSTLEAMLNSYASVPPCDWVDSLSPEVYLVSAIGLPGFTLHSSTSPLLISSSAPPSGPPPLLGVAASAERPASLAAASLSPRLAQAPGRPQPLGARCAGHSRLCQTVPAAV